MISRDKNDERVREILKKLESIERETSAGAQDLAPVLTKREHFAGLAMQAILSRPDWGTDGNALLVAGCAIAYAEALLQAMEVVK